MSRYPRRLLSLLLLSLAGGPAFATAPVAAPRGPAPAAVPAAAPTRAAAAPAPTRAKSPAEIAAASPVPVWRRNGILVEQGGRALYVFDQDKPGVSRCDDRCMALWPPHYAEPGAKPHGPFTLARSFDGRPMWAWRGQPLYRWVSDRRRGAAGGDGVADVWFLVKVPAALQAQVTPYFPMPMPRSGTARAAAPSSANPPGR